MWIAAHAQNSISTMKRMLVSLSPVYWFFQYLRSDSQKTTNKARYDAICVQKCPNFNIWGYGLRSKRFEGSRLSSKIILGLQAMKRWDFGLSGKNFTAPSHPSPPPPPFAILLPGLKKRERKYESCIEIKIKLQSSSSE